MKPLPASNHKFWKDSTKIKVNNNPAKKCEHEFKRTSPKEVCCIICNIGFIADGSLRIEDGKLVV